MSQSVRQANTLTAEDWQAIYRSFKDVDFRAYDFDTIRSALIDYVRAYYPEQFNDYIESSEFVAIIELLSYLATSLAFRVDLNSRENFLDTAERRESIVRLARMLSYTPKRNLAATGLFKLTGVQTNETVTDSLGRELNNVTIFWNDPNNPDSFEQFITVMNAALVSSNPFGRPFKTGRVGNIPTDLYQFQSIPGLNVAYNINVRIRGDNLPVDVVNPDFNDGQFFFERAPDPDNPFHAIYRNDGDGLGSPNTGFFLMFKQGQLQNVDERFDFPERNRVYDININNINETDVFLQEIDQVGTVLNQWTKVPSLIGNNVIFNSVSAGQRNIFSVIPRLNDQISLKFSDGVFGDTPVGIFRTWVRTSANRNITIRPDDVQNYEISVPYTGKDGQEYTLRMLFSLEQTVSNAARAETNDQIKTRASQVYYTQNRMVNGEDYNVFPLTRGNEIVKLKALNRSHAGHSRYIDINDPTGTFQNTIVFGEDGALYADDEPSLLQVTAAGADVGANQAIASVAINNFLNNQFLKNYFYSVYYFEYLAANPGAFDLPDWTWRTQPQISQSVTGYLDQTVPVDIPIDITNTYIKPGAKIKFVDPADPSNYNWVTVKSLENAAGFPLGFPAEPFGPTTVGGIELSAPVREGWQAVELIPRFRTELTQSEINAIVSRLLIQIDFGLGYSIDANNFAGGWYVVPFTPAGDEPFDIDFSSTASWLMFGEYSASDNTWLFKTRGKRFVFESADQARFFFEDNVNIVDVLKGRSLRDEIEILPVNTQTADVSSPGLGERLLMNIQTLFTYEDGYRDPRKALVKDIDLDRDGVPDNPLGIINFINDSGVPVYFERFTDFDGYEYFRLWKAFQVNSTGTPVIDQDPSGNWQIDGDTALLVDLLITDQDQADIQTAINAAITGIADSAVEFAGTVVHATDGFFMIEATGTDTVVLTPDSNHIVRTGRSFTLDSSAPVENPLYFRWKHYAPIDNRIDPSISNVIDMYLLTSTYFRDISEWKDRGLDVEDLPREPTTEALRSQFGDLNQFKMMSDQIIFKSGRFKLLFGTGAEPELRARFKVVRLPTATITDNEVRSRVVQAIDEYFDIANWDFGEGFFYTELSTYIHQRLANVISTVVIVPEKANSAFGNLFQIKAEPNEIFLSTATVADVDIVRNLTETNLRIR